jgi:hypothetical protein
LPFSDDDVMSRTPPPCDPPTASPQRPPPTSKLDASGHRWCPVRKQSCPSTLPAPLQENVIESTSTDLGAVSDTDSGLGVHETCDRMPGPPARGRKGAKDTPRTPIDNPAWQVGPAEEAPAATTSSALPGAVARTDNARPGQPQPAASVMPALRDPSHYEELSIIGNGKPRFTHATLEQGDQIGRFFFHILRLSPLDSFFENYRSVTKFGLLFPLLYKVRINFSKKWVGIHFRQFFHKLLWSPCSSRPIAC